jgi:cytochrome bd ubiquinol oxidase subunit I
MDFDPVLLARLQFAFTISFHIIFPSFTIGLSAYIATLHVTAWWTGRDRFRRIAHFWTKIFAVSFGMGVVSGVVLSYQLGTNWSRFSHATGNIIGPLAGYEVLSAFFLEASFLAILLFGEKRVPRWLHVLSAVIVAAGTAMSAFWILSASSWMHTPAGHELRDGVAYPLDWVAIVFNPSFPYRFAHMLNASYLTAGFVVLAVAARYLVAGTHVEEARTMLRMAIGLLIILSPLQVLLGDLHGLNTLKHQPMKVAAMEAHWDSSKPGDFHIFAWPDEKAETNHFAISIPRGSSLILTHDPNGLFPGLKDVEPADRPPLIPVFFAFRIMIAIGFFMPAAILLGAWLWWRGALFSARWYLLVMAHTWWLGFVAVIAGWVTTETGRQPASISSIG